MWRYLKYTSVTSLDVDVRKWKTAIYLRIGRRFEDWTSIRGWTSIWVLHIYYIYIKVIKNIKLRLIMIHHLGRKGILYIHHWRQLGQSKLLFFKSCICHLKTKLKHNRNFKEKKNILFYYSEMYIFMLNWHYKHLLILLAHANNFSRA